MPATLTEYLGVSPGIATTLVPSVRAVIIGHRSTGRDRDAAELVAGLIRSRLDDAGYRLVTDLVTTDAKQPSG